MGIMKYSRLGDTFFEDKAKKINQALEKINAPYYQVCKKVRGSKANKDAFDISWRKRNITCDTDYPNATTTGEKVVMRQLEKHFGISLSLLNSDTPRAIKKSLDYQKAQQTILDNKIKARQERERAAAERKALRNAPKTKTPTKTTTTKSIPPSERNDNKAVASKNNEVFTEVDGNITYFYTETKNNRRRNHAKLNIATNRITYLNSAVPMYVKEFIKGYKSVNILNKKMISKMQESKSSPAKSTKAVEEKKEIEETMRSVSDIVQKLFMDKGYFTKWNLINFVNPITGTIKDKNNIKEVGKIKIEVGNMNDIAIKTMRNDFSVFIETPETNNTFYGRKSDLKDKDWLSEFKEAINEFIRDNIDKKETNYDIKDIGKSIEYELDQTGYDYKILHEINTRIVYGIYSYITSEKLGELQIGKYGKDNYFYITTYLANKIGKINYNSPKNYDIPIIDNYEDSDEFEKPFKELKIELDKLSVARREQEEKKEEMLKKINLKVKKYSTKDIDLDEEEEEDAEFQMEYGIKEDEEDEKREKRKMGLPTQEEINEFVDSFNTAIQKVYFYTIIPALNLKDKVKVATTVTDYKYKYPYNTIFYNNSEKGNIYISIEEINNIMNPFYINLDFKFIDGSRYIGQKFVVSKDELDKFKKLNRFDKKFEYIQSTFDKELRSEMSRFLREIVKKEIDMLTPKREEPQYTKVKATDFARKMGIEVNEMKPMTEPETTEIIKETPPIMIDEDEAAKFDKGLDELTKLLQQAMQG